LSCAVRRREVAAVEELTEAQKTGYIQIWYRENGDIAISCLEKHQVTEVYKSNRSQNKLLIHHNQILEVREFSFDRKTTDLIDKAVQKGLILAPSSKYGVENVIYSFDNDFIAANGFNKMEKVQENYKSKVSVAKAIVSRNQVIEKSGMCFKLELMLTQLDTVKDLDYEKSDWVIYFHRNNGINGVFVLRYPAEKEEEAKHDYNNISQDIAKVLVNSSTLIQQSGVPERVNQCKEQAVLDGVLPAPF